MIRMNTAKDPLHGKSLKSILEYLVEHFGWEELGKHIRVKCFTSDPSVSSSLVFLRKTSWAREKVENLYLSTIGRGGVDDRELGPINLEL